MSDKKIDRRDALKLLGAGAAVTTIGTGRASATGFFEDEVEFDTLRGNQGPFVGEAGTIRGVPAGGLPWVLEEGSAELSDDEIEAEVEGLVLDPTDDRVPADLQGVNPVPTFKAVVSCLTFSDGTRQVDNVETDPVETDEEGDAKIEADIDLPDPCYAPIVFVTAGGDPPGTLWFAVGGL